MKLSSALALFVLLASTRTAADEAMCEPGKYVGSSEIELAVCVRRVMGLDWKEEGLADVKLDLELVADSLSAPYDFDCAKNFTDENGHGYCYVDCANTAGEDETVKLVLEWNPIAIGSYSLHEGNVDGSLAEPSFRLDGCRLGERNDADGTPTLNLVLISKDVGTRQAAFVPGSFQ